MQIMISFLVIPGWYIQKNMREREGEKGNKSVRGDLSFLVWIYVPKNVRDLIDNSTS